MKQRSRKVKGRRLTNFVREKILKAFPHLRAKDITCADNGLPGPIPMGDEKSTKDEDDIHLAKTGR